MKREYVLDTGMIGMRLSRELLHLHHRIQITCRFKQDHTKDKSQHDYKFNVIVDTYKASKYHRCLQEKSRCFSLCLAMEEIEIS